MKRFETIKQAQLLTKKKIRKGTFKWMEAAAEDGYTDQVNLIELQKIKIKPKFLVKTGEINLEKKFFKNLFTSPIIISPMGHQTQFHRNGEAETAKGAKEAGALSFLAHKAGYH